MREYAHFTKKGENFSFISYKESDVKKQIKYNILIGLLSNTKEFDNTLISILPSINPTVVELTLLVCSYQNKTAKDKMIRKCL